MRVESILSHKEKKIIERLKEQMSEINQSYFDRFEKLSKSAINTYAEWNKLMEEYRNDKRLGYLRNAISDVYIYSDGKILVIAENQEESKALTDRFGV